MIYYVLLFYTDVGLPKLAKLQDVIWINEFKSYTDLVKSNIF